MSEKSYAPVSLTMGHLSKYYDLSNYAILLFLCHHVGDKEFLAIRRAISLNKTLDLFC